MCNRVSENVREISRKAMNVGRLSPTTPKRVVGGLSAPRLDNNLRMLLGIAEIVERLCHAIDPDLGRDQ